ncbi:MAG: hypothetical protein M9921_01165 [Fimbriimonadaceae bacterium]|nr:hypothetical protein [Fimbriimonadaceae bacterium]
MIEVVEDGPLDGRTNMDRDRALFERAEGVGAPGCRVYRWDGPWVSLGRFQRPERDLLDPKATPWVMRPTGGKAVLHGHDLTVGLAAPLALAGAGPRELKVAYRWVAAPIIAALRACGVAAALGERTRFAGKGGATADCFTHVSPNDIVDERTGVKVCGCALLLGKRALLLQASIPCGPALVDPTTVIRQAMLQPTNVWDWESFHDQLGLVLSPWPLVLGGAPKDQGPKTKD